ncbi:MAG: DNA-3-methyladenine glycosylase 2 family protein [Candidatus Pacebacteria bacterium]|nr:DNA-3-methyladenine glycosylase 2 family protein [Candidatus Paceibacterota bacterium]MBP9842786.1 DNA-3-methyladenine glycosylase 2 family protein [Candidatus Paceibacterota bacterium]
MDITLDTGAALKYFKKHDPLMAELLKASLKGNTPLTLPTPKKPAQYFGSIVTSIVSQQVSTHAARAINARVKKALGTITPKNVVAIPFDTLKACGLSTKKTEYIKRNAELWHEIQVRNFVHMDDEDIIKELIKLYGIGRWTAEMFLIFSMGRPDVFSYGDLGLMQSFATHYKPHHVRNMEAVVNMWSPYRTIASLVLWYKKDI